MHSSVFISTTRKGISRAYFTKTGDWNVRSLLSDYDVRTLAADPLRKNIIYAGTQGNGILRSDDYGETWHPSGLDGNIVKAIAVSKIDEGVIYAGTKPPLIYVSEDGGKKWRELTSFRNIPGRRLWFSPAELPGTAYVQAIALSPTNPNIILAGIEFGAVVGSEDCGINWSGHRSKALRDCHSLMFHFKDGNRVYEAGGTGGGAAASRDSGKTWIRYGKQLDRHYGWACAADPDDPDIWYCSASTGPSKAHSGLNAKANIYRWNEESGWRKISHAIADPLVMMPYVLLTNPESAGHIYAGFASGEVWHSNNYGDSWKVLPFVLDEIHRTMIMI